MSYYAAHRQRERVSVREFFTADVEGIESVDAVDAVGAVFEQVFFGLCEFLLQIESF